MSLIKAYNLQLEGNRDLSDIKTDFLLALEAAMMDTSNFTKEDIASLIKYYTEYSVEYLQTVAQTLEEPYDASSTMKFMNSYIASLMHEAKLHYYNKEKGYSIIDKAVQHALDNQGLISEAEIFEIFGEIEASYIEEELEEPFEKNVAETVDET